ncbi:hypothetical protein E4U41_006456 [Claviceps citrina]|nr:hypothetical protein E4U41_006456 [Claviceps citrina]
MPRQPRAEPRGWLVGEMEDMAGRRALRARIYSVDSDAELDFRRPGLGQRLRRRGDAPLVAFPDDDDDDDDDDDGHQQPPLLDQVPARDYFYLSPISCIMCIM